MFLERFILTVVGKDHPGIVAGITDVLFKYGCNIQELNQTVLSDEFAMILLLHPTKEINIDELNKSLKDRCEILGVSHNLRPATTSANITPKATKEKVIITVIGSDKIGIIAGVTKVLADMNMNIIDLSAEPSVIHDIPQYSVVARVEIDEYTDMIKLKKALDECAKKLSVEIEVQSQDIFRAMHRI